jgi:hypothetical protein
MEGKEGKEGTKSRSTVKVQVHCLIDIDVVDELRRLIQEKYKYYGRGLLSWEIEQALRAWIAMHKEAQEAKILNRINPRHQIGIAFVQVKQYLLDNYYDALYPGVTIPLRHLEEAIMAVRGTDKRTVRKWLELFHRYGLIKPITQAVWEFVG